MKRCSYLVQKVLSGAFILLLTMVAIGFSKVTTAQSQGEILFMSDREGNREIYSMNVDGTRVQRLTFDPTEDTEPTWSPNRQQIAFASNREGEFAVYIMDTDGSNIRRLSPDVGSYASSPSWSPDGINIAYVSNATGNSQIHIIGVDGFGDRAVTQGSHESIDPAWSPDGGMLVFATNPNGNFEIFMIQRDGTGMRQITNDPTMDSDSPSWAPDSDLVVFAANSARLGELNVMNSNGGNVRVLVSTENELVSSPAWSPDGRTIIYSVRGLDQASLRRVNFDGFGLEQLDTGMYTSDFPAWAAPILISPTIQVQANFDCRSTAQSLDLAMGESIVGSCPSGCSNSIWGTDVYTDDSSICTSAIHTGAIDQQGGVIRVTIEGGRSSYSSSRRNGILSRRWGRWGRSFVVTDPYGQRPYLTTVFELSCQDSAQVIAGEEGTQVTVMCPAQCNSGRIWGTDIYTDDSAICTAAQHAGTISSAGGEFHVVIEPGQRNYVGSTRNGVTSNSWGNWHRSFSVSE